MLSSVFNCEIFNRRALCPFVLVVFGAMLIYTKQFLCSTRISIYRPASYQLAVRTPVFDESNHIFWGIAQKQSNFVWKFILYVHAAHQLHYALIFRRTAVTFAHENIYHFSALQISAQVFGSVNINECSFTRKSQRNYAQPFWHKLSIKLAYLQYGFFAAFYPAREQITGFYAGKRRGAMPD